MKKELTEADIINWWMVPYHGITIEKAFEDNPWTDASDFYQRYQCTQEQHDEWYNIAVKKLSQHFHRSVKRIKRDFCFTYLNTSPMVKSTELKL